MLDTTFFLDLKDGDGEALSIWDALQAHTISASYSPITVYELWVSGRWTNDDERYYERALSSLDLAPVTIEAAKRAAGWLRLFDRDTRNRRLRDALIAATAQERNEPVYTRDVRGFRRFGVRVVSY